jgi:hypothetical protein
MRMSGQSTGAGILQITAFAGASFYSFGPGLGKRGRKGIFEGKGGWGRHGLPGCGCAHRREGWLCLGAPESCTSSPRVRLTLGTHRGSAAAALARTEFLNESE